MVTNFVDKYGKTGLHRICEMFFQKQSNQVIAKEFGVTRQRVHQWQKTFVITQISFSHDVVVALDGISLNIETDLKG